MSYQLRVDSGVFEAHQLLQLNAAMQWLASIGVNVLDSRGVPDWVLRFDDAPSGVAAVVLDDSIKVFCFNNARTIDREDTAKTGDWLVKDRRRPGVSRMFVDVVPDEVFREVFVEAAAMSPATQLPVHVHPG